VDDLRRARWLRGNDGSGFAAERRAPASRIGPSSTMRYVPYHELGGRPCIVVDGAPCPEALITLSHWPQSGTPEILKDDLSTQTVFHYLDRPEFHVAADAATNDHFDEDGLAGLFAVTRPDEALARRQLVCDFASAGDFGTYRTREAAYCAFFVSAYADPERSPLGASFFRQPDPIRVAGLYTELLGHLPALLDHPERYADLWREEASVLDATERAIRSGAIRIEEVPSLDLAVVTLPPDATHTRVHRFAQVRQLPYHPMAIYNATQQLRVLYIKGRSYEFEYRYESWVQYMSRRPLPRVDLSPLAERLSADEAAASSDQRAGTWAFDGVAALTSRFYLVGAEESRIAPEKFRRQLEEFLATAPPAWDPYSKGTAQ
jgi:hypothetical protein